MTNLVALPPAQPPVPFDPPVLYKCRRVTGIVQTTIEDGQNASKEPSLERQISTTGNILLMEHEEGQRVYLLQRKLGNTLHGSIRVGYVLKNRKDSDVGPWELKESTGIYPNEMVSIMIEDVDKVGSDRSNHVQDPQTELSALQLIAEKDPDGTGHVVGTSSIGSDQQYTYTILPFHREGLLLDYCAEVGRLNENEARCFFWQILKVQLMVRRIAYSLSTVGSHFFLSNVTTGAGDTATR